LPDLPQRATIVEVASRLRTDDTVVALWVGGSLARGAGDRYSDVDFRVAVEAEQFASWRSPLFSQIFTGTPVVGRIYIPFGNDALLHHLVLGNGEIFDFFVQSTSRLPTEEPLLILGCRSEEFARLLKARNDVPEVERLQVGGDLVQDLLVSFWISSHKHRKTLGRDLDPLTVLGVQIEQTILLRLWYIEASGWDCNDVRRQTIHSLTECIQVVEQALGPAALALLGMPMGDREELCQAIESTRHIVAQLGRRLAERYGFAYPSDLETTVLQAWELFRQEEQDGRDR
jgi:hypothetical protein